MKLRLWQSILAALIAVPLALPWPGLGQTGEVDLALVVAIDVSYSVDSAEYRLQMAGLGDALQSDEVHRAILAGENQKIALTVFQWSDDERQGVILPWTIIDSLETADAVGAAMRLAPRSVAEGGTSISGAMLFGATLFGSAPKAVRRVIDISTDGRNNMGRPAPVVRDFVVAQGITINGLAINNEWPGLTRYLERQVVGGTSAFVEEALSYDDFGAAILRKLVKEIRGPGLT